MEEDQKTIRGIVFPRREVEAVQVICQAALFAAAGLGLETIDQIDDIVKPPTCAVAE